MNKYKHSKIYKIVNDVDDMVYVGSTTLELYERWGWHLCDINKKRKLGQHILNIGFEHFKIVLICNYPCNTLRELLWKEMEEANKIEEKNRLNTNRPLVSQSNTTGKERQHEYDTIYRDKDKKRIQQREYRLKNVEIIHEKQREYHHKNKEKQNKKSKEWGEWNKDHIKEWNRIYWIKSKMVELITTILCIKKRNTFIFLTPFPYSYPMSSRFLIICFITNFISYYAFHFSHD